MNEDVKVSENAGVLEILLDRPAKKNAITDAMYGIFAEALVRADAEDAIRAVLIRGAGADFCAGNDLGDFLAAGSSPASLAGDSHVARLLRALACARKPIVAAVQGRAIGIGTTMLLHCDLVYVSEDARLSTPFVNLALVPEAASSLLLPARIGHVRAFEMIALGQPLSGAEAAAIGLANRCVPGESLEQVAREAAAELTRRAPGAVLAAKALMRDVAILQQRIAAEAEAFADRVASPEAQEVFAAFIEKRQPDFSRS